MAAPIEQQVNGVEQMLYMQSSSTNDGSYSLEVTFEQGMNMNLAQVLVQNRVNLAMPLLPDVIKQSGVTMRKRSPDIVKVINFNSPDGTYDQLYLSNFVVTRVKDEMLRVEGVGDVFIIGQRDYSMRIWVDPDKLAARGISTDDVVNAIREQNQEAVCGYVGQEPAKPGQETQIKLSALGRLTTPEEFANIVIRVTPDGRMMRLKDVARVELGAKNEDVSCRLDGRESAGLAHIPIARRQRPRTGRPDHGQNEGARKDVSQGCHLGDAIRFHALHAAVHRARSNTRSFDSIILVAFVVLLFLQNWRSALIPLVAVPVAILGTFAVMIAMGFTLNNLTLFGLVLAIGIVVDDAIVVVEAVEHHIENGMSPRDATIQRHEPGLRAGDRRGAGAQRGVRALRVHQRRYRAVLPAVRLDHRRLDDHIRFNSLTLSPALAAKFLRAGQGNARAAAALRLLAAGAAGGLHLGPAAVHGLARHDVGPARDGRSDTTSRTATRCLPSLPWLLPVGGGRDRLVRRQDAPSASSPGSSAASIAALTPPRASTPAPSAACSASAPSCSSIYGGMLAATWWGFVTTPKGFVPAQDMGYMIVNVQLPDASSIERTREVTKRTQEDRPRTCRESRIRSACRACRS